MDIGTYDHGWNHGLQIIKEKRIMDPLLVFTIGTIITCGAFGGFIKYNLDKKTKKTKKLSKKQKRELDNI